MKEGGLMQEGRKEGSMAMEEIKMEESKEEGNLRIVVRRDDLSGHSKLCN
jgi:hypothetical protein